MDKKRDFPYEVFEGVDYHEGFTEAKKMVEMCDSITEMTTWMEPLHGVPEDLDTGNIEAVREELLDQVKDDFRIRDLDPAAAMRIICKHHANYECIDDEDGNPHVYTLERMD